MRILCSVGKENMGKYDNVARDYFGNPERAAELFWIGVHHKRLEVMAQDFRTDLKLFFRTMQCRRDKRKLQALFKQSEFMNLPPEAQKVIVVHLGDKNLVKKVVEEGEDVCKALQDWAKEERDEGKKEGRQEKTNELVQNLVSSMKCTVREAVVLLKIPEEEQEAICRQMTNQ